MVAVTQPNPSGGLVVTGHTPIQIDRSGAGSPNLIVHFADAKSVSALETLGKALTQSKRTDAPTAIVAVVAGDHIAKAPHVPGVIYTDDVEAWQHALNLKSAKGPLTAIIGPHGGVAWHEEGPLDLEKLGAALAQHLVKRGPVQVSFPRLNARIGQPAPNFAFEYAPGRTMPLSKLSGKPAVLVFWKSSVKPSIQAIRDLQTNQSSGTAVLAVNDGEDPKVAHAAAKENGITATVVTDPKREIAAAYGVNMWPTILTLSESGVISGIQHGHTPGEKLTLSARTAPTTAKAGKRK
jgi:peroxiredoxin